MENLVFALHALTAIVMLTGVEVVLGFDNQIMIFFQTGKLPTPALQERGRVIGLVGAGLMRIVLVLCVGWIIKLEHPLVTLFMHPFSGRDLIMLFGGLYLLYHSVREMTEKVNGLSHPEHTDKGPRPSPAFWKVIANIMVLDLVFSLDSVLTAIGLVESVWIMIVSIMLTVCIMLCFSGHVGRFINKNPELQILALSFLILIAVLLIAEGFGKELPKGYVYFAMAFAFVVDMLQMHAHGRQVK